MDKFKKIEYLNLEFEKFFKLCQSQAFSQKEMKEICGSLENRFKIKQFKRIVALSVICIFIWTIINVNCVNDIASAIGRIVMIKLIPFWNWPALHNAKCLISYKNENLQENNGYFNDADSRNCALCEHFVRVKTIADAKFYQIQERYLEKGHPIIINNSHSPQDFLEFSEKISSLEDYINTDPCDVESSFLLSRFVSIEDLLHRARSGNVDNNSWFFHLRNCQFKAVKASRKFTPRPKYHPTHLAPFYSSWLLMSSRIVTSEKQLYVDGVVIVLQIVGEIDITLTAKEPCKELCEQHNIILNEGEALVFLTDLWKFSYVLDNFGLSATVITETRWE